MKRIQLSFLLLAISVASAFGQGFYLEYKLTTQGTTASGVMKTYYQDGSTRTESSVASPQGFNINIVGIIQKANPGKMYQLNVEKKTYTEMDISQKNDYKDYDQADYQVTVLGKEKVNGFNSTHVQVKNMKDNSVQELWTSTDLNGYADLMKMKTKYTGKDNLNKALAAKGAAGFPVRVMVSGEHTGAVILDLVKAERKNIEAAQFSIEGYTKSTNSGSNMAEMMQKIQNMTPEEREKYMQQLKQQYGQH